MKKIYLLLGCFLSALCGQAQFNLVSKDNTNIKRCATVDVINQQRISNPNIESDAHFESWINNKIAERRAANPLGKVMVNNYNLPIIFHIISNGEAVGVGNNIAQSALTQQIIQLNKDYANLSNSPYAVSANTGIQFSLAQKDALGNTLAEPGIERINRSTYGWTDPTTAGWTTAYIIANVKPATIWDPSRYINVWLVPYMPTAGGEILGFATFPSSSGLTGLDNSETNSTAGVVIKATVAGSVFSPYSCAVSYGQGRTLSHEFGHFFGLRHIWGDATCGTDFVDDTPIHETSNSGVPVHPKANICGTADEMFENYMDYSDDNILNTFTSNQVDRMQTVMLNSPRRVSLASSNVGLVTATGTNRIAFSNCSGAITVTEGGLTGTYPRYRDVNLYLNVEDMATGTATVTFTTGGTAVLNKDYSLPASVSFASGDRYKPITLRVIDNAAVDGDRTVVLSYTISGTGVTAGTAAQTETITILDDDNIVIGQNTVNAIAESFENGTGTYGLPTGWGLLLSGGYVNRFVTSANGSANGSGKAAHITNDYISARPNTYTKAVAGAAVLQSPLIDPSRYMALGTLSFKYRVGGRSTDNAILTYNYPGVNTFYYYGPTAGASGYGPYYSATATPASGTPSIATPSVIANTKFSFDFYWQTAVTAGGTDPGFNLDDVIFTATPFNIETAVSSSYGYDLFTGTVNNYKSSNRKVIAQVSASNTALTNITAAITEAGTDRVSFSNGTGTFLRSRKVITVTPSPANSAAQYTIKLYYTTAELAAWGASIPTLKIMKVNSGTSLSGTLNGANSVIVTPTQFEDSSASRGYYAYTATFTGFSQFVLVDASAVLPLKLLSFTGKLEQNKVKLTWKTANEINNMGFDIERSTDAVSFTKIGWADASATNNYEAYDATIVKGNTYYYRLKQINRDGTYSYSPVVSIYYNGDNTLTVYPNPVVNSLVIEQSGTGFTQVVITDVAGKKLYSNNFSLRSLQINTQAWSKGVYLVRVYKGEVVNTFKVIK